MSVKLDSLIEKIKSDGVEAAKKQAGEILADTEKKAAQIIKEAEEKADSFQKHAEAEAESYRKNAEIAISQAARDTVLKLKEKITAMFDQVLLADIGKTLKDDFMRELIGDIAEVWAKDKDIVVLINGVDPKAFSAQLKKSLSANVKGEIEIKLDRKIEHGFRIGKKGEDVYYDFTDESILDAMKIFLNPKLAELLK